MKSSAIRQREKFFKKLFSKTDYDIELRAIYPDKRVVQIFTREQREIEEFISLHNNANIYFGAYTRKGGGTKEHVKEVTCLFTDIDGKDFKGGKKEILSIIRKFKIMPTIINDSGHGYHVYWLLKKPIEPSEKIEAILRGLVKEFKGDMSCAELARVMRVPATINHKKPIKVKANIIEFNNNAYDLKSFLKFEDLDSTTTAAQDTVTIEEINSKCAFMKYCYDNRRKLPEPLWYAMVSNISRISHGGPELVHQYSIGYPRYSKRETDNKILHAINGSNPHTCATIKKLMKSHCRTDCGKNCGFTSPIVLINRTTSGKNNGYFIDDEGFLCEWKKIQHGTIPVRISNFTAEIIKEIKEDDGEVVTIKYLITGTSKNKELCQLDVSVADFFNMKWYSAWGNAAILQAGQTKKDILRHYIQSSSSPQKQTIYTHTGWHNINGEWEYLTANSDCDDTGITVKLSREVDRYSLPTVLDEEKEAIRASLSFIEVADKMVSFPLFALTYLAPLTTMLKPMPNFSAFLFGVTGTYKTTITLLCLAHYGDFGMVSNLPNFESTANSLVKRAFTLKDILMAVDDYHPSTTKGDSSKKENIAQRLIRSFSNRTDRSRLNPDTSEKRTYPPRGMLLITGEDIVSLQSTLARLLLIEIEKGSVKMESLNELQGAQHLLPHAMKSYVTYLKKNMSIIISTFPRKFQELREKATKDGHHKKLPEQVAFMQFALETVLSWMCDRKVITSKRADKIAKEGWEIFIRLSNNQAKRITNEDPVTIFIDILKTLIIQNKVSISHKEDNSGPTYGHIKEDFIGVYDGSYFYLIPSPLWNAIKKYSKSEDSHFPVSKHTLYKILGVQGLIEKSSDGRNLVNQKIRGHQQKVLKLKRDTIWPTDDSGGNQHD